MDVRKERELRNLSQQELADKTGIPKDRIAKWEQRGSTPKTDDFIILDKFFKDNVPQETLDSSIIVDNQETYLQKRRNQKNISETFLVPFVDIPAQAGYKTAYGNIDYIQTLKKYPILPDVDPAGAIWRYFQVQGDSMEDSIMNKDVILASQVPNEDWEDIKNYYTYVIVTDEDLLIKDVYRETKNEWLLLSINPKHDPKRINVNDIRQLWVLRRHIKARVHKPRMYDLDAIKKKLSKK